MNRTYMVCVRTTPREHAQIKALLPHVGCRTVSEYIRKLVCGERKTRIKDPDKPEAVRNHQIAVRLTEDELWRFRKMAAESRYPSATKYVSEVILGYKNN